MSDATYLWRPGLAKGIEAMDRTHREFVELLGEMIGCEDEALLPALERMLAHTRDHFDQENRWMAESGFPPIAIHQGEHLRVLAAMEAVLNQARQGALQPARRLLETLPQWFEQHAATMDHALAAHMRHVGHPEAAPRHTKGVSP